MTTEHQPDLMTMGELADYAHTVGIDNVAHLSKPELIEAIDQQRETNGIMQNEAHPAGERRPGTGGSMPAGWENFPNT